LQTVLFAVVGDMYFVHERGSRVAVVSVCITGLANLPAVLSGLITVELGWRWMFWMLSIFLGIGLVLVCLFGEETAFTRPDIYNTDTSVVNVRLFSPFKNWLLTLITLNRTPSC
jgi:MFS family permease